MNNLMPPCCESGRMLIPYEGGATFGYGSVTPVTPPPGELAPGGFHFAPCGVCNRFNTEWGIHFARAASTATLNSTVAVAGLSRSERGARPGNLSVLHTKRPRCAGVPARAGNTGWTESFLTSEFRGHPFLKSVAERRPSQPNADESRSTRTDGTVLIRDRAGNQTRLSSSSSPSNRHPGEAPDRRQGSLSKTPVRETRLTQY